MAEEFAHPGAIVSTAWVAERLREPSVVVAEIDSHLDETYEIGHVPGAVGWGLHTDMEHPLRRDIPDLAQFEALMRRSGIEPDTTVVLYGDGNNRSATWAFWVMKYYGHDDVRIMDGGRTKWVHWKAGRSRWWSLRWSRRHTGSGEPRSLVFER